MDDAPVTLLAPYRAVEPSAPAAPLVVRFTSWIAPLLLIASLVSLAVAAVYSVRVRHFELDCRRIDARSWSCEARHQTSLFTREDAKLVIRDASDIKLVARDDGSADAYAISASEPRRAFARFDRHEVSEAHAALTLKTAPTLASDSTSEARAAVSSDRLPTALSYALVALLCLGLSWALAGSELVIDHARRVAIVRGKVVPLHAVRDAFADDERLPRRVGLLLRDGTVVVVARRWLFTDEAVARLRAALREPNE